MNNWHALLALAPPTQSGTAPNPQAEMLKMFGMIAVMGILMYFIVIRPQRSRQKQLKSLMEKLKSGDKVLTASGIVATVISVKDKTVTIRSADTKLEVLKSTISEITEKAGDTVVQS